MRTRFNFDQTAANTVIGLLTPGFLMMAIAFIGFESFSRIILGCLVGLAVLASVWLGFTRGTYAEIDTDEKVYRTAGFFMTKTIPLSDIVRLNARGTFAGLMTEITLTYRDKGGKLRTIGTINKQSLKQTEMKSFIDTLQSANPSIAIPQELLD